MAFRGVVSEVALNTHTMRERETFWSERFGNQVGSVFLSDQGGIVGCCDLIPSEDNDADPGTGGEIAAIYVEPQHWREGAGRALCHRVLAEARQQRYQTITLWALEPVGAAREFYTAMGFRLDGAGKTVRLPDGSDLQGIWFRMQL